MRPTRDVSQDLADLAATYRREDWPTEDAETVGHCARCDHVAPLRRVPETEQMECRPCWDRDTLGPEGEE